MKIRAKIYDTKEVYIIGFVTCFDNCVHAVYVDRYGKVSDCSIDRVKILDSNYIPR